MESPGGLRSWSKTLPAGPATPSEARLFLLEALKDQDVPTDLHHAALLTSEIATNAVKHGAEPIDLSISLEDEGLRVSVFDRGPGFDPGELPSGSRGEIGGWGLKVVEDLSSEWGVERQDEGTEVWFRI